MVVEAPLRRGDAHAPQRLDAAVAELRVGHAGFVCADRLADLVAHGVHRVERGHRLLENHRDLAAPHLPHVVGRQRG